MGWSMHLGAAVKNRLHAMRRLIRFLILLTGLHRAGIGASFAAGTKSGSASISPRTKPPPDRRRQPSRRSPCIIASTRFSVFNHYQLVKAQDVDTCTTSGNIGSCRARISSSASSRSTTKEAPRASSITRYTRTGFIVAKGKYEPREGTPLFINGPDFNEGRLIFVLEPRPPKNATRTMIDRDRVKRLPATSGRGARKIFITAV